MTVSRPSALDFWPNDVVGKESLSRLRTYAQELRAIFGSIDTIPDRVKSLWQKPDEYKKDISDMTSYLQLVQKIPDYIEEVVDLSTEYVISVHGSGIEMEDDGKLHHAYSISSRQLAVDMCMSNPSGSYTILRMYLPAVADPLDRLKEMIRMASESSREGIKDAFDLVVPKEWKKLLAAQV